MRILGGLTVTVILALGLPLTPAGAAAPEPDPFGELSPIMVVLDTSGSMEESIGGLAGETARRIDAAQGAILDLLPNLSANRPYGMLAYPGRNAPEVDGCAVGRVETPLAPVNLSAASAAVRRMNPDGGTPTGPALLNAGEILRSQFGDSSGAVIVLVSDGESNCGTPPCDVAKSLRSSGLEVQVNTVGLKLEGAAADEMRCIADATGGRFIPVDDGAGLRDAINAGALAQLALAATAPRTLAVVSGTGSAGGGSVSVTVTSSGRTAAADVRVSVLVSFDDAGPGSVLVPSPVRFLGNLAAGSHRTIDFSVRPDDQRVGAATWTVTVTARNAAPQTATGTTEVRDSIGVDGLGPLFDGVTRVAVLGDSYSSGEGATGSILNAPLGYYTPETDGRAGSNACHRAAFTYARDIFGEGNVDLIACSGAQTTDFLGSQQSGAAGTYVRPQLEELRELMNSETPPEAVFLSIGGNDAGFSDVVARCMIGGAYLGLQPGGAVLGHDCFSELSLDDGELNFLFTSAIQRALDVQDDVRRALANVDAVANSPAAIAARDGRIAPIVLLPYPRIVPAALVSSETPDGCAVGLSGKEFVFLNQYFTALNTSVSLAAYSLRSSGRPVYVASDVEDAFLPDHTICEGGGQSYAVFVTAATALANLDKLADPAYRSALLHPNAEGHEAMARAIVAWSNSRAATPIEATGSTPSSITIVRPPTLVDVVIDNPVGGPLTQAGGAVRIVQKRLMPGTTIQIRLDSTPRTIGSATVGPDGTVDTIVRLPPDTPVGDHHIVVFGVDTSGQATVRGTAVTVLNSGGSWLVVMAAAGLIVLLVGGLTSIVTLRATRKPRADRPAKSPTTS